MKPIYENISVAFDTSFKVATYNHSKTCESTNWHIHLEYELVYIKNGSGVLRLENQRIDYKDGALLFLGPKIPHADFGNKEFKDNLEVVLQFGKEFVDEKLAVFPEFKSIKKLIQLSDRVLLFHKDIKEELAAAFENFQHIDGQQRLVNFISILEKLTHTSHYDLILSRPLLDFNKAIEINRLESVFEYVNNHYSDPISSQTLAMHLGLTTNSFCRFFKK